MAYTTDTYEFFRKVTEGVKASHLGKFRDAGVPIERMAIKKSCENCFAGENCHTDCMGDAFENNLFINQSVGALEFLVINNLEVMPREYAVIQKDLSDETLMFIAKETDYFANFDAYEISRIKNIEIIRVITNRYNKKSLEHYLDEEEDGYTVMLDFATSLAYVQFLVEIGLTADKINLNNWRCNLEVMKYVIETFGIQPDWREAARTYLKYGEAAEFGYVRPNVDLDQIINEDSRFCNVFKFEMEVLEIQQN
jgi:hypothetical protein